MSLVMQTLRKAPFATLFRLSAQFSADPVASHSDFFLGAMVLQIRSLVLD